MYMLHKYKCIKFIKYNSHGNYIYKNLLQHINTSKKISCPGRRLST